MEFGIFIQNFVPAYRRNKEPDAEHNVIMEDLEMVQAADKAGFKSRDMISGAGHDAAYIARVAPTTILEDATVPRSELAIATAWAWLPELTVQTPRRNASGVSDEIAV